MSEDATILYQTVYIALQQNVNHVSVPRSSFIIQARQRKAEQFLTEGRQVPGRDFLPRDVAVVDVVQMR